MRGMEDGSEAFDSDKGPEGSSLSPTTASPAMLTMRCSRKAFTRIFSKNIRKAFWHMQMDSEICGFLGNC